MSNNNIEQKYNEVYNAFLKSDENTIFTKTDVKEIIEAHKYKEIMENYKQAQIKPKRRRNIIVSAKRFSSNIFSLSFFTNLFLTYLFYVGALVVITSFIYPNIIDNKPSVFLIAIAFLIIDKVIKPLVFFFDLISFTFHKIGLFTLGIFSLVFYILGNVLSHSQTNAISFERSVIVALIVLFITFVIDFIDRQSLFKTKMTSENLVDQTGSEHDE